MRVIIEVRPGGPYWVWREGVTATVGPMMARMGARVCNSEEEVLEAVKELLPEYNPEIEGEIKKAQKKLFGP